MNIILGMKILWILFGRHHKIRLVLGVISMYFRSFLRINVQNGDIYSSDVVVTGPSLREHTLLKGALVIISSCATTLVQKVFQCPPTHPCLSIYLFIIPNPLPSIIGMFACAWCVSKKD